MKTPWYLQTTGYEKIRKGKKLYLNYQFKIIKLGILYLGLCIILKSIWKAIQRAFNKRSSNE